MVNIKGVEIPVKRLMELLTTEKENKQDKLVSLTVQIGKTKTGKPTMTATSSSPRILDEFEEAMRDTSTKYTRRVLSSVIDPWLNAFGEQQ